MPLLGGVILRVLAKVAVLAGSENLTGKLDAQLVFEGGDLFLELFLEVFHVLPIAIIARSLFEDLPTDVRPEFLEHVEAGVAGDADAPFLRGVLDGALRVRVVNIREGRR